MGILKRSMHYNLALLIKYSVYCSVFPLYNEHIFTTKYNFITLKKSTM